MPKILSDKRDPVKQALGEKLRALKREDPSKLEEALGQMSNDEAEEILHDPEIFLRQNQWIDLSHPAPTTLILSGRGWGKSYTAMATLMRAVERHGVTDILLLARTARDIRSTLVPALMDFYPSSHPNKPNWSPGTSEIQWKSGAKAICISAESGSDSVRGLNTQLIIADEVGFYGAQESIVTMSYLTLRRPPSKMIAITSPYATPLIIDWVNRVKAGDPNINFISGTTYENTENLSDAYMDTIVNQFEGTSMARQELYGELVLENPSALFQMATISRNSVEVKDVPAMKEYSIGIDPSVMSKKSNVGKKTGRRPDDCGIVVSGSGMDGYFYALDNFSGSYSVEGWIMKLCEIYDYYNSIAPTTITVEINTLSEELLQDLFKRVNRMDVHQKIKVTFSTQNKLARLQPYALQAEQDKIKFVNKASMGKLYTELTTYDGTGQSPDTADAWAFSMTHLSPVRKSFTYSEEFLI